MKTIYQLRQIADRLRLVTETGGISAEDTFGLQSDVLKYIAEVERNLEGMGIHKVYASYAMMVEDGANPVGTNGKYLRFGQLVAIWNPSDPTQSENGNVYAWQKGNTGDSAWLLMGNLCSLDMVNGRITENAEGIKKNSDAIKANGDAVSSLEARVERSVRLSELGSYFVSDAYMDRVRSGDVSVYGRWKVTDVFSGIDVVVGVVDVFVDSMLHCLTQRLLTNMVVSGSGELGSSHDHRLHALYRLYNLSWTEEKLPDGSSWPLNSWSAWKEELSGVLSSVEELRETSASTVDDVSELRERMSSAEELLSVMSDGVHVVMFGGFCSGSVLNNSSNHKGSDEGVSVMWNVTCGRFVLYVSGVGVSSGSEQYSNWADASLYGSAQSGDGWLPFSDRLYIDVTSNTLYYFRDGEIRALSGGGGVVVDDDESISDDEIVGMF